MSAGSCSNWGGSNYITFDGTSYSFWDNCTHVIVKEIHPRHGNLTILLDNYFCGAATNSTRCSRALIVYYKSMEIVLTTTVNANGQEESLVSAAGRVGMGLSPPCRGGCSRAFRCALWPAPEGPQRRERTLHHAGPWGRWPWGQAYHQPRGPQGPMADRSSGREGSICAFG